MLSRRILTLGVMLAASSPLHAQGAGRVPVETYSLDNGLKVVLIEDHHAPVVAVDVTYDVGSRNEVKGKTGFAHVFEHMMYQGSENVKKGEHMSLLEAAGAAGYNGSTHEDFTNYYQPVPSNRMNLALWLEADRMRSLAVTDTNFTNQREVVKEERRMRVDNQPYGRTIFEATYAIEDSTTCFPYAHSVIGSMDDLNAGQTPDVQAFFKLYYAPNNATLVIAGDFEPAEAKRLVQQYFGGIPRGETPPPVSCTPRFNTGARRQRVLDSKANLPAVVQVYKIPAYDSPDYPALQLLSTILGQGASSRLNRSLAREQKLAAGSQMLFNVFGPRRGPGHFSILTLANQGVAIDSLEKALNVEVARVAAEGVTADELTKAKNLYRSSTINDRQRALSLAQAVQMADLFLGSPEAINTDLDRYMKVSVEDVRRVAATYLRPDNSLTLIVSSEAVQ
jgi:predicted Zn-dependent peptidase